MSKDAEYLQFGGMAVPEGVMMRSPNHYAVACLAPNGEIVCKTEPLEKTWIGRQQWLKKPFLRGTLAMLDTMALGIKAMNYASNIQLDPRYMSEEEKAKASGKEPSKALTGAAIAGTMVVSLALGLAIFRFAPELLAQLLAGNSKDNDAGGIKANYIAEIIKVVLFIGYLSLIRRWEPIYEVFRYHGAEHKAINVVEADQELSIENAMGQTRLHPRCGTNFAIIVILIGFLLFPLIPRNLWFTGVSNEWLNMFSSKLLIALSRLAIELMVLPIIAGISYEIIRAAGKAKDQRWVNILLKPGLATQFITTAEPAEKHCEVAIRSLKAVMKAEETGELDNTDHAPANDVVEDVLT